ncbi:hypothetical protein [Sinomicrobium oceani]|uniref:hypothetical protein n=1 Tax=Sinomicrobium oceani TaxID=1150368 RepID=UPI00227CB0A2|nr:hypothetical protein [Sinomicrobium oceani]
MQLEYREQKTDGRFVMYCHSEKLKGNGIRDSIHTYNTFVRNKGKAQTVWLDETPSLPGADRVAVDGQPAFPV